MPKALRLDVLIRPTDEISIKYILIRQTDALIRQISIKYWDYGPSSKLARTFVEMVLREFSLQTPNIRCQACLFEVHLWREDYWDFGRAPKLDHLIKDETEIECRFKEFCWYVFTRGFEKLQKNHCICYFLGLSWCVILCITSGDWQAQGKISSRHF